MTTKSTTDANILVVDDVPENLHYLMRALTDEGFHVRPATSGKLALEAARIEAPDLVLLDIKMPDMDGYRVCEELKKDPQLNEVPVIFVSALDDTFDRVKAFAVGGVDYVSKPLQVEELIARVRTHVRLHRLQRERKDMIERLEAALHEIKTLKGFIPICANCKKIRNDEGYWERVEAYISEHTDAKFTHGICPDCIQELYPELEIPPDEHVPQH